MINRIVRMSFQPDKVEVFLKVFEDSKKNISSFQGCNSLKLLKDIHSENIYFTYSEWESENDLDVYRNSELFASTWSKTKILFNDKPLAWSTFIEDNVK